MTGKCKLCGKKKDMCKQSHIIPNFMYQDLFDEKNRMYAIQFEKGDIKQKGIRQTGEFEANILCQDCDNGLLGELERYASLILYPGYSIIIDHRKSPDGMTYTYLAELDYAKFKLFLLSLLWRSSICSRPSFKQVSLGPHEEHIRRMLLEGNPGEQLEYPCHIMTYLNLKNYPSGLVAQPSRSKVDGGYVYTFFISGMIYTFYISKHIIPKRFADVVINPEGELKILHMTPKMARKALNSVSGLNFA